MYLQLAPTCFEVNTSSLESSLFLAKITYIMLVETTNITYVILARNRKLPDDDVLTSKHVGASCMYIYVTM